jgi:uncharacterized lipoprotein
MPTFKLWLFGSYRRYVTLFAGAVIMFISACGTVKKTERPVVKPDFNNTANNLNSTPGLNKLTTSTPVRTWLV